MSPDPAGPADPAPAFPEPDAESEPTLLLSRCLGYYRATVVARLRGLAAVDPAALRVSRVPSGWAPLGLLDHLVHMERRWVVWGFLGEPVVEPWGDHAEDQGAWRVPDAGLEELVGRLEDVARRTTGVLASHAADHPAATGGRFAGDPPSLASIGVHLLGEYARHAGHLDVVVELAGGPVGE